MLSKFQMKVEGHCSVLCKFFTGPVSLVLGVEIQGMVSGPTCNNRDVSKPGILAGFSMLLCLNWRL